jgi:hypothetical protein
MKKRLNVDIIQSELRGGSAFFPGYKGTGSPSAWNSTSDQPTPTTPSPERRSHNDHHVQTPPTSNTVANTQGVPPSVPRTVPRTGSRPPTLTPKIKRPIRQRQPFDIYEDQYVTLKQIADNERGFINGRSMSQMVRDAIDAYLRNDKPQTS